jgi:hypothetical protein
MVEIPLVKVQTRTCIMCGQKGVVEVPADQYLGAYVSGANVQDAFPSLDRGLQEQLITGTHPACWDELFRDEEK